MNKEKLKSRVKALELENQELKVEIKSLWEYVQGLEKHFEDCWNALRTSPHK